MRQRRIIKGESPIGSSLRGIVLRLITERGRVLCALRSTIDRMEKAEKISYRTLGKLCEALNRESWDLSSRDHSSAPPEPGQPL